MNWKKLPPLYNPAKWASKVLYFFSLTQYCYCTQGECEPALGLLISGWAGLYLGGAMLSWLANPLLFVAWNQNERRPILSLFASLSSLVLMLNFLLYDTIYDVQAGHYVKIIKIDFGYWLWIASGAIMVCKTLYDNLKRLIQINNQNSSDARVRKIRPLHQ